MIFLTGASGLIGAHVARSLLQQGFSVKALKRADSDLSSLADVSGQIEWIEGDVLDPNLLRSALKDCQQVVHCAGVVSFSPKDEEKLYQVNVEGTAALVNAALENQIERFVHISSVGAIGRPRKSGLINEQQKWEKSGLNSWYGETKYLGELEVWRAAAEGLSTIILNPSVVLGPGPLHRSSTQLFGYVASQKPFYPPGSMNWIDVRDLCEIVLAALQPGAPTGERFIISAGSATYLELFSRIAACLNVAPPKYSTNSFFTSSAYYLEKIKGIIGKKEPIVTKETLLLAKINLEFDNSKTIQAFNFTFRPIEETIRWVCKELKPLLL